MHESQHLNKPQLARYLEVNWDYPSLPIMIGHSPKDKLM